MKKLLLLVLCLCGAYTFCQGQINYYAGQTQVSGNGFVYKVLSDRGGTKIYNINNRFTNLECTSKDGSPLLEGIGVGDTPIIEDDNWTCPPSLGVASFATSLLKTKLLLCTSHRLASNFDVAKDATPSGGIQDIYPGMDDDFYNSMKYFGCGDSKEWNNLSPNKQNNIKTVVDDYTKKK